MRDAVLVAILFFLLLLWAVAMLLYLWMSSKLPSPELYIWP